MEYEHEVGCIERFSKDGAIVLLIQCSSPLRLQRAASSKASTSGANVCDRTLNMAGSFYHWQLLEKDILVSRAE